MNLWQIGIPYTGISSRILELSSKTALTMGLRVYGGGYIERALSTSPYQLRKHNQDLAELRQRGILTDEVDAHGRPKKPDIPDDEWIAIPTFVEYNGLSLSEMKTLIALFREARHKRSPFFTFTGRHEDLAKVAQLSRERTGRAIASLAAKRLITVEKERKKGVRGVVGTKITLVCPQSGASLNGLAWFYIRRIEKLTAPVIYKMALENYDPGDEVKTTVGFYNNVQVHCPLCLEKQFRFTADIDQDEWKCFACKRQGNSASLYAHMMWKLGRQETFRITMAKIAEIVKREQPQVGEIKEEVCANAC